MSLIDLVARLRERDIRLWLQDGALRYSAPGDTLDAALRAELTSRKAELIAFLSGGGEAADGPVRRTGTGPAPLAPVQQRLWLLDQMRPGNPAYHMPAAVRLTGRLDTGVLKRAFNAIIARHDVLRTTFAAPDGHPVQRIAPTGRIALVQRDLRDLPPGERDAEVTRLSDEEAARPFDLEQGPLLRTTLLRTGDEEHILLLTLHHIVADGWSVTVLARELAELYDAYTGDRPSPLPELPVQYADFAAWHAGWLRRPEAARQLDHWRDGLGGDLPTLDLPADGPRPQVRTFRAGRVEDTLPGATVAALRELSRAEGASLYMTMLAAFTLVLHRQSGQDDIIVGIPEAGRNRSELEALIGFFVNTLAVRTALSGDPEFRTLLRRVRDAAYDAYAHRDVPFEEVLTALRVPRRLDRTPVFQVFFNMLPFAGGDLRLPGLQIEFLRVPDGGAKFDLTVYVSLDGREIALVYNADLFSAGRMDALLGQYLQVLGQAAADPDRPVSAYDLVTPEAAAVLPDLTPLPVDGGPGSIVELFDRWVRAAPDRIAVDEPGREWTYGEIAGRAYGLAGRLRAAGVGACDVVVVHGPRGAGLAAALLGVLSAGAAFVVLDPAEPDARLADQVRRVHAAAFVETPGAQVPPELAEAVRGLVQETPRDDAGDRPPVVPAAADLAYVAFTSGSTGRPKGVRGSHGPLAYFAETYRGTYGLTLDDRFALLSAPGHDPMLRDVLVPLALGATVCVPDYDTLPGRLAGWLADRRVTVANMTPATLEFLAGLVDGPARTGVVLRHLFFGGDRLLGRHVTLARQLAPGVRCVNFYGATETPQAMSAYPVPAGEPEAEIPLGPGLGAAQLVIRAGHGGWAGIGELGEIWVRSPHLALGYLDDEALTAERFQDGPGGRWFRTGDLGRYRPDGTIALAGRADRQIKIRGFRVEPGEVEARLLDQPGVTAAAVAATISAARDRRLAAWFTGDAAQAELGDRLRAVLPDHMVPAAFVRLDEMPRLSSGKIDYAALPAPPEPGHDESTEHVAPRTDLETVVARIWAEVLEVPQVGVHDDFFALGGHSMLATLVTHRVREELRVDVAVRTLFETRTVAALAKAIDQQGGAVPVGGSEPIRAVARIGDGLDDGLGDLLARLGSLAGDERAGDERAGDERAGDERSAEEGAGNAVG